MRMTKISRNALIEAEKVFLITYKENDTTVSVNALIKGRVISLTSKWGKLLYDNPESARRAIKRIRPDLTPVLFDSNDHIISSE